MATNIEEYITTTISAVSVATAFGYMVSAANSGVNDLNLNMLNRTALLTHHQSVSMNAVNQQNAHLQQTTQSHIAQHAKEITVVSVGDNQSVLVAKNQFEHLNQPSFLSQASLIDEH